MTRFTWIGRKHAVLLPLAIFGTALVVALSVGVSVARAAFSDCPSANFCLWHDGDGTGTQWNFNETNHPANTWFELQNAYDNSASYRNYRVNKTFVDETDNGPQKYCFNPGDFGNLVIYNFPNGDRLLDHIGWVDLIDSGGTSNC
jgi:peptidase inhibitor family I36